jgi:hypothetical protein
MPQILTLKPNVTREEAIRQFSPRGLLGAVRDTTLGPLRSVAQFYIPFQLFRVRVRNGGEQKELVFGLDAVSGALDLYRFEQVPGPEEVASLETRNCPQALLHDTQAEQLVTSGVQRLLFAAGFFRIRELQISAEPVPGKTHIPYWVGFRGRGAHARLVVIDAVRRRPEGVKVRRLLQDWLTSVVTES